MLPMRKMMIMIISLTEEEISMDSNKNPYVLVEFNGTRKAILREKLPEARKMEAYMQDASRKAGTPPQEIAEQFTLRILEDKE